MLKNLIIYTHILHNIFITGEDVNWGSNTSYMLIIARFLMSIEIYDNYCCVVMEMASISFLDFLYVLVSHLLLLCSFLKGSSN